MKIKDRDIIAFVEGKVSKEAKKKIKAWVSESSDHADSIDQLKKVVRVCDHLETYNTVETSAEWDAVLGLLEKSTAGEIINSPEMLSDSELYKFISGDVSAPEREKVLTTMQNDTQPSDEIALMNKIVEEAPHLLKYINTDSEEDWRLFNSKIQSEESNLLIEKPAVRSSTAVNIVIPPIEENLVLPSDIPPVVTRRTYHREENNIGVPSWIWYLAAALITLALCIFLWTKHRAKPVKTHETYTTTDSSMHIDLPDGSAVKLGRYSELKLPIRIEGKSQREVSLWGEAEFVIAEDAEQPFVVEIENEIGIEASGTRFKVMKHADHFRMIENDSGEVYLYPLDDIDKRIQLSSGNSMAYEKSHFIDLDEPKVDPNTQDYTILYVLDYLMANSGWKVISSPGMPFDESSRVQVNLDQPLEAILLSLRERADFDYRKLSCDNCYQITRFKAKTL